MKTFVTPLLLLSFAVSLFAEGTKELRPTTTSGGMLNPWDWGGEFATYNAAPKDRMYVHISDFQQEKIYMGFNAQYSGKTYVRIKDPNDSIVYGPIELKSFGFPGFIPNYTKAVAGPSTFNPSGYTPLIFTPHMNGDYSIELNRDHPVNKVQPAPGVKGGYRYNHFDITVGDSATNQIKDGRLWAYKWALTSGSGGVPFNAKMYVLRSDSIRFEVDYNGIDPFGFGIVSNSFGIDSTGSFFDDRRSNDSLYTQGTVPYQPRHKIFVNPPDSNVFPYPKVEPSVDVSVFGQKMITGCILTGYCFNLVVTKEGQVTVTLDLDGVPGFQQGGRDRVLFSRVFQGANCISWDGLDGLGDTARSANISVNLHYQAGLIHIPIYDAENHPNGYIFSQYKGPGLRDTLALYWDDSEFGGQVNLGGCTSLPCRDYVHNYGNERFINTWSAAYDERISFQNIRFEFCPPVANNDSASVKEGQTVGINPLSNDVAVLTLLDPSSIAITCWPGNGTVTFDTANGRVRYSPNFGFLGTDTICYAVCDTSTASRCDTAMIFVTVIDANLPPDVTTVNGQKVTNDTSAVVTAIEDEVLDICLGWIDYDQDSLYISGVFGGPYNGVLAHIFDGDSCFSYTPAPNYFGPDTLVLEVCDNESPSACDTLVIPINVLPVNDAPRILSGNTVLRVNDTIATLQLNEDNSLKVCFSVTDIESHAGDVSLVSQPPLHGSVDSVNSGDSCFYYTPGLNYNGFDTLSLIYCDQGLPTACDTVTLVLEVLPVNDPPVAIIDYSAVNPGDSVAKQVMVNDFDVETQNLNFTITGMPKYGTAKVVGDSIRYISNVAYPYGIDTVAYSVCDTGMPVLCTTGYYVIAFPKNNISPVAQNDTCTTPEDVPLSYNIGVNDYDPNSDPLSFTIIGHPANGQASLANNILTYRPDTNFFGLDSLVYQTCDTTAPQPLCDTAVVYISVLPQPDKPVILDSLGAPLNSDSIIIFEDTPVSYCLSAVDGDKDMLDVSAVGLLGGNGTATGLGDSDTCFTYTPNPDFNGSDSVQVIVCDNSLAGACDTLFLQITILPVNDAPEALPDTARTALNNPVLISILSNDNDQKDQSLLDPSSVQVATAPQHGSVTFLNGIMTYSPSHNFIGKDSLEYSVCDLGVPLPGLCTTTWVYVWVDPKNDKPVAVNDTTLTQSGATVLTNVLLNDTDPDNDTLEISIINLPNHGSITLSDSNIVFVADGEYCGPDSLQYSICDKSFLSKCDTAWVYYYIAPSDDDKDSLSNSFETLTRNTDMDARKDYMDIDSDNDGIYDMTEAFPIRDICNPSVVDFDGDGTPDYRDWDSDNDGLPDYVERSTKITLPAGVDADGDGVDDAFDSDYGGYLEGQPVDTDGDGFPDFRDTDSDNDGRNDADEMGGDPDHPLDTDGDGKPDFRDIDSDGDGLTDDQETDDDCDGDGIPNWLDPESCELFVPQGISPNGDGVNDYLVIPQIDKYPDNSIMIFNRWGNKVYSKNPYDNSWQGNATERGVVGKGEALPAGTYYYIFELGDNSKPRSGYIYLKR